MCLPSAKQNSPAVSIYQPTEPPPAAPIPAAAPAPTPSESAPQLSADVRRSKIAAIRYGMLSTIKTGPQGVGATPTLGSSAAGGTTKTKLGQ